MRQRRKELKHRESSSRDFAQILYFQVAKRRAPSGWLSQVLAQRDTQRECSNQERVFVLINHPQSCPGINKARQKASHKWFHFDSKQLAASPVVQRQDLTKPCTVGEADCHMCNAELACSSRNRRLNPLGADNGSPLQHRTESVRPWRDHAV